MEKEDGYTALQFKWRRNPEVEEGYTALQLKGRRTPEDEEGYTALQCYGRLKPEEEDGYTALQLKGRRKAEDRCEDVQRADAQSARFQRPALWIIVSLSVLLVLAVVGSGIWIFKLHKEIGVLTMNLKQRNDCDGTNKSALAHPTSSCPLHWHQRGRMCYYFPEITDEKDWSKSHEDCSSRGSRLVVIENKDELDYLVSKLTYTAWIGLFITPASRGWTWVNGSSLNDSVFGVRGPDDEDWCGVVVFGSIVSSRCINSLYWICQKEVETSCSRL
ncbi:killer cell lectin-like receptor subfamily B member 1B allele A [Lissotriton helveticus]